MENITLIFPGFIVAILIVLIYEYKITQMCKEPRNKVRFFMERVISDNYVLYIKRKNRKYPIASARLFENFGLNPDDFADMKKGEVREVFINLED